jgi:hypothetical protein
VGCRTEGRALLGRRFLVGAEQHGWRQRDSQSNRSHALERFLPNRSGLTAHIYVIAMENFDHQHAYLEPSS